MATNERRIRPGPRTPQDKAAVSRNALKHGLTAKKHIVLDYEDPAAFQALRDEVRRGVEPVGPIEARFAHRIAVCLWRLDRAERIESAIMDQAFQDVLLTAKDQFTPVQRFQRALIASVNNHWLEPNNRYETTNERRLFRSLHELDARQASRMLGLPISPGTLRITLPAQPPLRPAPGPQP